MDDTFEYPHLDPEELADIKVILPDLTDKPF